ncbi:MAG TPA: NAD(+)/NADH kinase [Bryobacteraceae bacterium]|jgi:NAD+ kinase
MPAINTAGILSKPHSPEAARIVPGLIAWLREREISSRLDHETASYAHSLAGLPRHQVPEGADLLIVLGGDGTLLSAARAVRGRNIPLFAVNLGGLGFLTAIKIEELYPQLELALSGSLPLESRRMLLTELWREEKLVASYQGLNDMVLAKAEIARMIDLKVNVDDSFVCVYKADGLIVTTPTGSTAYSLSAGGPIVFPSVAALTITPICPHMLTNRPVIVPDESVIQITVAGDDQTTYLTIDGQVGELLKKGDLVVCRRSEYSISLVRPPNLLFFDVLREKLKWGGR